jgi:putative transposase
VASIVGYLKGKSAMIMFEKYSRLKRNFKGHSFWLKRQNSVGFDPPTINT